MMHRTDLDPVVEDNEDALVADAGDETLALSVSLALRVARQKWHLRRDERLLRRQNEARLCRVDRQHLVANTGTSG